MMPEKLERCVSDVKAKQAHRSDRKKVNPWAVCVSSTGLKPHKGKKEKK